MTLDLPGTQDIRMDIHHYKDKLHCSTMNHDARCEEKVNMELRCEESAHASGSPLSEDVDSEVVTIVSFEDHSADRSQTSPRCLDFRLTASKCGTGGRLWSSAHQLASFVFAHRQILAGKHVLELGCGLGLPSLVASHFAAKVVASDSDHTVVKNIGRVALQIGGAAADTLSARELNFSTASGMSAAGLRCWDVVLFADCVYSHEMGAALPHAISALLKPDGMALAALPPSGRVGLDDFWAEIPRAGLSWQKPKCWPEQNEDVGRYTEKRGQLYMLWKDDQEEQEVESPAESVTSLFHDL